MDQEHRSALQSSLHDISQELDAESVLPYLLAAGVLRDGHAEEIRVAMAFLLRFNAKTLLQAVTRSETRSVVLINCLKAAGPLAFEEFINALLIIEKGYLAQTILDRLPTSSSEEKITGGRIQVKGIGCSAEAQLDRVQNSLKEMYKVKFRKANPFSLPFTFDIEKTWVSLALREDFKHSQKIEDHAELLSKAFLKAKMLVIEGKPATGKTSLMRRLAYEWAIGKQEMDHYQLVVYAEFRGIREIPFISIAALLSGYLRSYLDNADCDILERFVSDVSFCKKHRVLILLDGYDESILDKQCGELQNFFSQSTIEKHLLFNVVLTTRPGYLSMYRGQEGRFVFADVLGFTSEEQKQKYISNHFATNEETNSLRNTSTVRQLLISNAKLNELAETPLYLTFICLVHERIRRGTLLELFCNIIWWLLDRHQKDFPDHDVPVLFEFHQKSGGDQFQIIQDHYLNFRQLHFLGEMALENIKQSEFIESDLIAHSIKPIIQKVGLLIKVEKRDHSYRRITEFSFPHRTIQEFLAAFSCFCSSKSWVAELFSLPETNSFLLKGMIRAGHDHKISEFEKFLWQMVAYSEMPVIKDRLGDFFKTYHSILIDLDLFMSADEMPIQKLNWCLKNCSHIVVLILSSTSSFLAFDEPINLTKMKQLEELHIGTFQKNLRTDVFQPEQHNPAHFIVSKGFVLLPESRIDIHISYINFQSAKQFIDSINHLLRVLKPGSMLELDHVTVHSNVKESEYFTVATESQELFKFLPSFATASNFSDQDLNEALQYLSCKKMIKFADENGK